MMMKKLLFVMLFCMAFFAMQAQIYEPVKWSVSAKMDSYSSGVVNVNAAVEQGWHLYGLDIPEGGPHATSVTIQPQAGVVIGDVTPSVKPIEKVDMIFHLKLQWWNDDVVFSIPVTVTDGKSHDLKCTVSYQACNDKTCTPPQKEVFDLTVGTGPEKAQTVVETVSPSSVGQRDSDTAADSDLWAPVTFPDSTSNVPVSASPWWYIFIVGFGGGLIALLTPCVWPMIPMTVSFFLKKNGSKSKSVRDAALYGASIVVIYLILGLAITGFFGAGMLNDLSTNAVFNMAFFILLVVFAISFFGAFDITLPSSWSNKVDSKAEATSGILSIFFMAFTLALVSFSCTGPIIGTLLVEAASLGDMTGPAIGMGGFALALALPFTLFAIFPSWLKEMPRSGGWLNSVKVVLGFLELALSLKFLSVADLAYGWGLLDREIFLAAWIVIFALLGLYLLGKIRFSHDTPMESVGVFRFFLALISLSFSVYLVPGLWGAPLKGVSAFVPPLYTQDFSLYTGGVFEEFDDYDKGMAYAAETNRPVLIDFSGYGCVNCRKMEGAVFDTPVVEKRVKENFVLIKLMVDDKKKLENKLTVEENGKKIVLETVGEKWSYLQRSKFRANSQPYYIMLDNQGQALSNPAYYDENLTKFVQWLDGGLQKYSEQ